jgi:hypothetical protein
MYKDKVTLSKEVRDVKIAQWEGFRRLAKQLPDHHVLAVDLVRTRTDETAAVFTVVRHGEPVQMVVMGDERGRVKPHDCGPRDWMKTEPHVLESKHGAAEGQKAVAASFAAADATGDPSPDGFSLGGPPPKQDPEPGIVILGTAALALVFGVGDPPQ